MPTIGIALKYSNLEDGRDILYLGEKVRRSFQNMGAFILPIVPVQDVDYNSTKYDEFKELTEEEKKLIEKYLDMVDGVILPGGFKVAPYDQYLLERCIDRDIPTLGICLGMQLLSNYKRKFLVELIESDINHNNKDDDTTLAHMIKIKKDTLLYKIIGKEEIMVNSYHKRHVTENHIYQTVAYSEDGIIEAIEYPSDTFNIGVQWHPERMNDFDEPSKKLLNYFVKECINVEKMKV